MKKDRRYIVVFGDSGVSEYRFWSTHRLGSKANRQDLEDDLAHNKKPWDARHILDSIDSIRLANEDGF